MVRTSCVVLALAFGLATLAPAADKQAKGNDGWKVLFDGKTLEGWKPSYAGDEGKVHVRGGALVLEKGRPMTCAKYTRSDFPKIDYEVRLEGKKVEGQDFFCTTTFPVGDSYCSLVLGGWGGEVVGLSSLNGMDASENETSTRKEFKEGQWYAVRIRVTRERIEAWIDGEQLVDADTKDRKISIRIECAGCRPFGLATYRTTGAVRNIRVRSLTDAEKKAAAAKAREKD